MYLEWRTSLHRFQNYSNLLQADLIFKVTVLKFSVSCCCTAGSGRMAQILLTSITLNLNVLLVIQECCVDMFGCCLCVLICYIHANKTFTEVSPNFKYGFLLTCTIIWWDILAILWKSYTSHILCILFKGAVFL
jgi:hypothetical protein